MAIESTTAAAPAAVVETVAATQTTDAVAQTAVAPAAPLDLFKGATVQASSNPERVKVIANLVTDYSKAVGVNQGDLATARSATLGLYNAIKMLVTLTGTDLTNAVDHLLATIRADKIEAFGEAYLFRAADAISDKNVRDNFNRLMNLFVQYANLSDRSKIRKFADIDYSVALITDVAVRKQLAAYFPR